MATVIAIEEVVATVPCRPAAPLPHSQAEPRPLPHSQAEPLVPCLHSRRHSQVAEVVAALPPDTPVGLITFADAVEVIATDYH